MGLFLTPVLAVEIEDDHDLVSAFLDWQMKAGVYSEPLGGHSGQGRHLSFFDMEDAAAVQDFFSTRSK